MTNSEGAQASHWREVMSQSLAGFPEDGGQVRRVSGRHYDSPGAKGSL